MKFLDKIKDLFVDEEEIIEEEVIDVDKPVKEEHKLPTFMRKKIEEEEKREERNLVSDEDIYQADFKINEDTNTNLKEEVRTRSNNFSFPIDIDDDYESNYTDNNYGRNQNVLKREKTVEQLYTKKEEPKPKRFKASPVISPVYGILDKNYTKEEVKVQDEKSYEIPRNKKVDFESVRNKAFGTLTDDLKNSMCENCELYKEVKITKKKSTNILKKEDNLLSDITEEDITLRDAEDNYFDFGVDYEVPKREDKNSNKEKEIEDIKIVNHNEEESEAQKIEVKEENIEENKSINTEKLINDTSSEENDIFNLIDSMYEGDE